LSKHCPDCDQDGGVGLAAFHIGESNILMAGWVAEEFEPCVVPHEGGHV